MEWLHSHFFIIIIWIANQPDDYSFSDLTTFVTKNILTKAGPTILTHLIIMIIMIISTNVFNDINIL